MDSRLKSCYLIYNIPPDCDSLLIDYVTTTTKGSEKFVANAKHQYDLMPVLQKGNLIKLELRCYSANAIEQPGWTPFVNSNKYSELFSLEDQLQQIRYIANQNEWKTLKKATSSNMSEAIEWFWEKHDTNPDVKQNDTREMFYDRVMKAEELFTIHKKLRGWRSDRGRVYIMHGPPDDIAEDFFSIGMYPMIKWYYYRENKVFTFVDKTGYGNYKIMDEYYEN
jgi:GWxTD domain-containing protein